MRAWEKMEGRECRPVGTLGPLVPLPYTPRLPFQVRFGEVGGGDSGGEGDLAWLSRNKIRSLSPSRNKGVLLLPFHFSAFSVM